MKKCHCHQQDSNLCSPSHSDFKAYALTIQPWKQNMKMKHFNELFKESTVSEKQSNSQLGQVIT